jgi:hypothetical protein
MLRSTNTVLETLRAMQQFLDDNAADIGPGLDSSRASLDIAVADLTTHFAGQEGGKRGIVGATQKLNALKTGLRFDHMRPIAEIAKRKLASVPEFASLKLPPANASTAQLIASATSMGDAAAPYTQTFVDLGLPADFVARMQASAAELTQTLAARASHTLTRSGATSGISAQDRNGRSIVKLLDSLVRPRIRSNAVLVGAWNAAIRLRRVPKTIVPAVTTPATATGTGTGAGTGTGTDAGALSATGSPATTPAATPAAAQAPQTAAASSAASSAASTSASTSSAAPDSPVVA